MKNIKQNLDKYPHVAILILNWNSWEDTIECLESLFQISYPNYSVVLIDNGSENESIRKIKEYADGKLKIKSKYCKYSSSNKPIEIMELTQKAARDMAEDKEIRKSELDQNKKLILIENKKNLGFAGGNNVGMKFALQVFKPEYLLLLNNDTAVEPNFLTKMVNTAKRHRKNGITGPKITYYDKPERNWFCRGIINWFSINIAYHGEKCASNGQTSANDYITGCAALIKKDVVEKIGYLDEKLFLYFEDADYSLRAKAAGFDLHVEPNAVVYHKVSATSYSFVLSKAQYYFSRNRLWFVKKYCPKRLQKLSLLFIFFRLFLTIGFFALKRERKTVTAIFEAYKDGIQTNL
jgi:GT2 family glycosyltransferase